ncbi:MAG: hypothetical protein K0Q73_7607 [Paenibacillus sp.]|jgi:hypothetical protein|nr:hypothetical protein [Paenibacillus sp.]
MRLEDLHVGLPVRISEGHPSGYGGRVGNVVAVGETKSLDNKKVIKGASVDIGNILLVMIEAESLEPVAEDELPPGWEEIDV